METHQATPLTNHSGERLRAALFSSSDASGGSAFVSNHPSNDTISSSCCWTQLVYQELLRRPRNGSYQLLAPDFCDWIGGVCCADTLLGGGSGQFLKAMAGGKTNRHMQFKVGNYRESGRESNIRTVPVAFSEARFQAKKSACFGAMEPPLLECDPCAFLCPDGCTYGLDAWRLKARRYQE